MILPIPPVLHLPGPIESESEIIDIPLRIAVAFHIPEPIFVLEFNRRHVGWQLHRKHSGRLIRPADYLKTAMYCTPNATNKASDPGSISAGTNGFVA